MKTRTLITGGSGFIGSHLAELLKRLGRELILVDDLSTGRRSNIEHLLDGRCRLINLPVGRALAEHPRLLDGVGEVYHLAAAVGVKLVVRDPVGMIRTNVEETSRLLEAAQDKGMAVLITSSSEVYGKGLKMPLAEGDDLVLGPTTSPRWSYALSKALDEHLALAYHAQGKLGAVIVRLFNTIGPRQVGRYGMVVPRFVHQAVQGKDLEIYGDGQQTRAFCDVRDVVSAMVRLLGEQRHHGGVFNVGSDGELTIAALADRVIDLAGSASHKRLVPYERAYDAGFEDPARRVPDLTRLRRAIDYRPAYSLDQTLSELIALARSAPSGEPLAETPETR